MPVLLNHFSFFSRSSKKSKISGSHLSSSSSMGSPRKNPPGGYLGTWRYVFRLLIYSLLLFVPILIPGPGLYFFTSIILSSFLPFYPCFILDPIHYPNHYSTSYPLPCSTPIINSRASSQASQRGRSTSLSHSDGHVTS